MAEVKGWDDKNGDIYTATDLKPIGKVFEPYLKKKDMRALFLEPNTADSQCIDSGAGDKPMNPGIMGGPFSETCYICGFKIDQQGSSGTDNLSQCYRVDSQEHGFMKAIKNTDPRYIAQLELKIMKQKIYRQWRGWKNPNNDSDNDEAPAGVYGPFECSKVKNSVYYSDKSCNRDQSGEPCKKEKRNRIYRKSKLAEPCGSQCEHILPIVTLAFLCGLKLSTFDNLIDEILNDTNCNYRIPPGCSEKMKRWRNKLYGLNEDGSKPSVPSDPDDKHTGVVYLWAHPYCNQFKDCHPFVDITFNLEEGPKAEVNRHNISFILKILQGKILKPNKKNLPLRNGWWNCIERDGILKNLKQIMDKKGEDLSDDWYNERYEHLTSIMESLKNNIQNNIYTDRQRSIFTSVCIEAVKKNIINQMEPILNSIGIHNSPLKFASQIEKIFAKANSNITATGGGPDRMDITEDTLVACPILPDIDPQTLITELEQKQKYIEDLYTNNPKELTNLRKEFAHRIQNGGSPGKRKRNKYNDILSSINDRILNKDDTKLDLTIAQSSIFYIEQMKESVYERYNMQEGGKRLHKNNIKPTDIQPTDIQPTETDIEREIDRRIINVCSICETVIDSNDKEYCDICEEAITNNAFEETVYHKDINPREGIPDYDEPNIAYREWCNKIHNRDSGSYKYLQKYNNIDEKSIHDPSNSVSWYLDTCNELLNILDAPPAYRAKWRTLYGDRGSLKYKKKKTKHKKKRKPKKKRKSKKKKSKRKKRTKQKKKDKKKKTKRRSRKKKNYL